MTRAYHKSIYLLALLAALAAPAASADSLSHLQDGTPVVVDEASRAVSVIQGSVRRPLWDGVYRLDNGTTMTVSGGVLINQFQPPDAQMLPSGSPTRCEALVKLTCGPKEQCTKSPGCIAAQQLLKMEAKERTPENSSVTITPTGNSCADAMGDSAYFTPCPKAKE